MRKALGLVALVVLPVMLSACSALGLDTSMVPDTSGSAEPGPVSDAGWVVVATGSATPKPSPSSGGSPSPALPPVSFLPIDPECAKSWTVDPVLIPMQITPGQGSLRVTWPRQRMRAVRPGTGSNRQPSWAMV